MTQKDDQNLFTLAIMLLGFGVYYFVYIKAKPILEFFNVSGPTIGTYLLFWGLLACAYAIIIGFGVKLWMMVSLRGALSSFSVPVTALFFQCLFAYLDLWWFDVDTYFFQADKIDWDDIFGILLWFGVCDAFHRFIGGVTGFTD